MQKANRTKIVLAFAAIYLVWGSTFSVVSIALESLSPMVLCFFRFFIGGTCLFTYCIIKGEQMPKVTKLLPYTLSGMVMFIGGVVAIVWAQQYISSSAASIVITTPLWFMLLDYRHWRSNFKSGFVVTGMLLCLVGVLFLLVNRPGFDASEQQMSLKAILIIVGGSFLWVAGSLYTRYRLSAVSMLARTSIQLLSAAGCCMIICFADRSFNYISWQHLSAVAVIAVLYLAIISTTVTFLAFIWLMQHLPASLVSTYAYVNPVVAVLLGGLVLQEYISSTQIFCMVIILAGVFFINIPVYKTNRKQT